MFEAFLGHCLVGGAYKAYTMRETRSHLQSRTRRRIYSEALLNDHVQILHAVDSIIQRAILCNKGMHMEVGI